MCSQIHIQHTCMVKTTEMTGNMMYKNAGRAADSRHAQLGSTACATGIAFHPASWVVGSLTCHNSEHM